MRGRVLHGVFLTAAAAVALVVGGLWALPTIFGSRILPRVSVAGITVGGLSPEAAAASISAAADPVTVRIRFAQGDVVVHEPTAADLGAQPDVASAVQAAQAVGREPGASGALARLRLLAGVSVPLRWQVNRDRLAAYLEHEYRQLLRSPKEPAWALTSSGEFVFEPGEAGVALPLDEIAGEVTERLAAGEGAPVPIRFVSKAPTLADADARISGTAAAHIAARPVTLLTDEATVAVPPAVLSSWVRQPPAGESSGAAADPELDREAIERYLGNTVAAQVNRPARDAQFEVSPGATVDGSVVKRATAFAPAQDGVNLDVAGSATGILRGLAAGAEKIKLVTKAVPAAVSVTPRMAEFGIRALVARGETDFAGSPKNRRHNIRVGAEKYHNLLIPPGAEFSFNRNLGPVEAYTGFLPELVILANVTTPQYGGGLCQVSTTMFRSAVLAGLPITARKNHAYAVSYYGTPGFDATIYPPNPDLRFKNDTPGHLLVQTRMEGTKLAFELWGTPDGRQVDILGPYPFDRKADGAVKARLVRKVTRAGGVTEDVWHSNYKSPKLFPKVLAANNETEAWDERAHRIAEKDRRAQEEFDRKKAALEQASRATPKPTSKPTPRLTPTPAAEEGGAE